MKKISIILFAAAAFALIGCSKNDGESQTKTYKRTVTVNVTKGADTKTAVNEGTTASYVWTEGDDAYFHVYENETEGTVENVTYTDKMKTATLTVSFDTPEGTTNFVYSAKFCKELSGSGNPKINANQSPAENSYDPAADVMIAEDISSQTALTSLQFSMDRKVSVNKMTLTGLVAGEKISKVEITFDKSVAGHYTGGDENPYSLNVKKLTLSYPDIAVPAGGSFPVYFVVAPNENIAFESVIVTTDQHVYTKNTSCNPNPFEGKTITFACGKFTRFNMGMANYGSDITSGTQYTLVESHDDLYSGATYLVVGNSSKTSKLYALGEQKSNNRAGVEVTDDNSVITIDNTIAAHPVIIEEVNGSYTLKDASSNLYLYTDNTTANSLLSQENIDDYAKWTISITNGVSVITNVGNTTRGKLCFNPNWQNNNPDSNPIFAGYKSVPSNGTDNLALYVDLSTCVVKADPELSYSTTSFDIDLGDSFTAPTLTNPHNLSVSYSSSNTNVASVNSSTGAVTIEGAGTAVITANFGGDETYKSGSASYTINVTDPNVNDGSAEKPYTASEARELALAGNTNEVHVKGIISSIVYSYSAQYPTFTFWISEDGTANTFEIYQTSATSIDDYRIGDYVVFKGTLALYQNQTTKTPEMTNSTLITRIMAPVFSPNEGNFTTSQVVSISADADAVVYYTTDGSIPSNSSSLYSTPITINNTTTFKAIAVRNGISTGIVTKTFNKVSASTVTVTFVPSDFSGQGTSGTGSNVSQTKDAVTISSDKAYGTDQLRVYKGANLSISTSSGNIRKIEFTFSGTYNGGLNTEYSYTGTKESVTFSSLSSQARFTEIKVTYE
ncbi:MAG: chitobiase/beta-hexosaminidase C-terminal domain-containing protein [Bacteroidales bacterium]|nr:chitobiase/beta-hexosaminidase C-terminal domain-containing protein [Bacteroidales bacterium]